MMITINQKEYKEAGPRWGQPVESLIVLRVIMVRFIDQFDDVINMQQIEMRMELANLTKMKMSYSCGGYPFRSHFLLFIILFYYCLLRFQELLLPASLSRMVEPT